MATQIKSLDTAILAEDANAPLAGFAWEYGPVAYRPNPKHSTKVSLGDAPHAKVTDVALFESNFPGVILAALDGTSVLVACQAVTRRMLRAVRAGAEKPTDLQLRTAVLNALRGIKNRGAVVVRTEIRAFGRTFKNHEEYMTFGAEFLAAKGLDDDTIAEILEGAAEETEVTE